MTREQALEKLRAVVSGANGYVSDRSVEMSLDGYVALGMLKLDEPKNAEQEFSAMLYGYINGPDADAIIGGMSQRGLKIVKA